MELFYSNIRIKVNENVYIKDPETSEVGKKIVANGVDLIVELGYEDFNFKKLAKIIPTTEATIYRYFESKHQFLAYLTQWYWLFQEYRLQVNLSNIDDPKEKMKRAIYVFTKMDIETKSDLLCVNKLREVVIAESNKLYHQKNVDTVNRAGYFLPYKSIVNKLASVLLEINPSYLYPNMLISTVLEGINQQFYFIEHLPKLTNSSDGKDFITDFYEDMILRLIQPTMI